VSIKEFSVDEMGEFYSGYSDDTEDLQCRNVLSYDTNGSLYVLSNGLNCDSLQRKHLLAVHACP